MRTAHVHNSNKFDLFKNRKKDSTPNRPSKNEDLCCFEKKKKKPTKVPKLRLWQESYLDCFLGLHSPKGVFPITRPFSE